MTKASSTAKRLKQSTAGIHGLLRTVEDAAQRASQKSVSTLAGMGGGGLALAVAYALSIAIPAVSFAVATPIALLIGIPAGIFLGRGTRRIRLEAQLEEQKLRQQAFIDQMDLLKKGGAPIPVMEAFWSRLVQDTPPLYSPAQSAISLPAPPASTRGPGNSSARDD